MRQQQLTSAHPTGRSIVGSGLAAAYRILFEIVEAAEGEAAAKSLAVSEAAWDKATAGRQPEKSDRQTEGTPK